MNRHPAPPDLVAALAELFERYSDARTDYGPAPTDPEIASPEAAALKALDLMAAHLGSDRKSLLT